MSSSFGGRCSYRVFTMFEKAGWMALSEHSNSHTNQYALRPIRLTINAARLSSLIQLAMNNVPPGQSRHSNCLQSPPRLLLSFIWTQRRRCDLALFSVQNPRRQSAVSREINQTWFSNRTTFNQTRRCDTTRAKHLACACIKHKLNH